MAKLNILSKNIMSFKESELVSNTLIQQNIEILSNEQAHEHFNIMAYNNNSKIIFIVNVPNYDDQISSSSDWNKCWNLL